MAATACGTAVPNPAKTSNTKITARGREESMLLVCCAVQILSLSEIIRATCLSSTSLITDRLKLLPTLPGPAERLPSSLCVFLQALHITLTDKYILRVQQDLASCRSVMLRTRPVPAGFFLLCGMAGQASEVLLFRMFVVLELFLL